LGNISQSTSNTPTLISTEAPSIAGINKPIDIEGVNIQILDVYPIEDWLIEYLDHNFEIEFKKEVLPDINWIDQNSVLVCGEEEYKAITQGISENENGKLKTLFLCYEVQPDIDYKTCMFQIKEYEISLASFFE